MGRSPRLELEYTGSAEAPSEYPRWPLAEIAVGGRSNSGKSSLLNRLAGRHDLARVSKTPGRTQRLHFFAERRREIALVDLPGYGWARVSREARERFGQAVETYLTTRENLRGLLLLHDLRRDPGEDERQLAEFTRSRGVGLVLIATKADKLGRAERERRLRALALEGIGEWIAVSAETGEGVDELVEAILRLPQGGTSLTRSS